MPFGQEPGDFGKLWRKMYVGSDIVLKREKNLLVSPA
jgi:hypothetical protein